MKPQQLLASDIKRWLPCNNCHGVGWLSKAGADSPPSGGAGAEPPGGRTPLPHLIEAGLALARTAVQRHKFGLRLVASRDLIEQLEGLDRDGCVLVVEQLAAMLRDVRR